MDMYWLHVLSWSKSSFEFSPTMGMEKSKPTFFANPIYIRLSFLVNLVQRENSPTYYLG